MENLYTFKIKSSQEQSSEIKHVTYFVPAGTRRTSLLANGCSSPSIFMLAEPSYTIKIEKKKN